MAKNYQYILLDWDGNIAQTVALWVGSIQTIMARHGHNETEEEIGAHLGNSVPHFAEIGMSNPDQVLDEIVELTNGKLADVELHPDALEVLEYLHARGKRLALVTSSYHSSLDPVLNRYNLAGLFDTIVTGHDVTHHKPHPEPLEKALAALGGTKDQAIMIGDTDKDVASAVRFGIDSVLFMPPSHAKYYDFEAMLSHKPTYAVTDFRNIMELIQ